jgi:glutamate synthase domain-containing protein 3
VKGSAGYRTGIHMKEFKDKKPVIIIGNTVGSFLGEYLAGGIIIVLGLDNDKPIIGNFTGTGIHGGKIFIRTEQEPINLPEQVLASIATDADLREISTYLKEYADIFTIDFKGIISSTFYVLKPNETNPYKKLYTEN